MDVQEKDQAPEPAGVRIIRSGLGVVVFGVLFGILMAIRYELSSMWLRALCAGCAGGVLGLMIFMNSRLRRQK
jgi:hypothetical protein